MTDERTTVVEFCLYRGQTMTLALVVHGDTLVPEIVAEALYAARRWWGDPGRAAPIVIRKLAKFYDTELAVGAQRVAGADVITLDFVSKLVSNHERRASTFGKWLRRYDVP